MPSRGSLQDRLGQDLAVGGDHADVGAERRDRRDDTGILERRRLQHRQAGVERACLDRGVARFSGRGRAVDPAA